jgi:hypothetical protein
VDALMTPIDLPNMLLFASGITVPTNSVGCVVNKQELIRFLPGFPSALGLEKSCFVKTDQRGAKILRRRSVQTARFCTDCLHPALAGACWLFCRRFVQVIGVKDKSVVMRKLENQKSHDYG